MNTILATVITCPQRWEHYSLFLQNIEETGLEIPVRTFVQKQYAGDSFANNNLNARAALAYGLAHLPDDGWLLYLEDDVLTSPALAKLLPELVRVGQAEGAEGRGQRAKGRKEVLGPWFLVLGREPEAGGQRPTTSGELRA